MLTRFEIEVCTDWLAANRESWNTSRDHLSGTGLGFDRFRTVP